MPRETEIKFSVELDENSVSETVYFTDQDGHRGATLIVNVNQPSEIPALAEPWFLNFNADCQLRIAMSPQDLAQPGLEELGKE